MMVACAQSVPGSVQLDAPRPQPPMGVLQVDEEAMPSSPDLDTRLQRFLDEEEEDRRGGRRERLEKLTQRGIDETHKLRVDVMTWVSEIKTDVKSIDVRVKNLEVKVDKMETRVDKTAEDTGNFRIETAEGRAKRSDKWWFALGGALIAAGITIAGDLVIRGLTHEPPPPVHIEAK